MGGIETRISVRVEPTLKYHPEHVDGLTPIPMKLGGGQCMLGSLTGAVSSILGHSGGNVRCALGCMLETPSASRRRPVTGFRRSSAESGATGSPVKMRPVRTISREVFVTPQRLHAEHPDFVGMVIQSELLSDQELR